jgi:hypothetical protein
MWGNAMSNYRLKVMIVDDDTDTLVISDHTYLSEIDQFGGCLCSIALIGAIIAVAIAVSRPEKCDWNIGTPNYECAK